MRKLMFATILILSCLTVKTQTIRYFEFRQPLNNSFNLFIVSTTDTTVINSVLHDLTFPINQRRFISGNITSGSGGFNYDGSNWYSWHFILNEWQLTTSNFEYCDGISSGIGNHPSVIAGDSLYFCPWNSYPAREVQNTGLSEEALTASWQIKIYPNPSVDKINIEWIGFYSISIDIYSVTGQTVLTTKLSKQENEIEVKNLDNGVYFVHATHGDKTIIKKLIKH